MLYVCEKRHSHLLSIASVLVKKCFTIAALSDGALQAVVLHVVEGA